MKPLCKDHWHPGKNKPSKMVVLYCHLLPQAPRMALYHPLVPQSHGVCAPWQRWYAKWVVSRFFGRKSHWLHVNTDTFFGIKFIFSWLFIKHHQTISILFQLANFDPKCGPLKLQRPIGAELEAVTPELPSWKNEGVSKCIEYIELKTMKTPRFSHVFTIQTCSCASAQTNSGSFCTQDFPGPMLSHGKI